MPYKCIFNENKICNNCNECFPYYEEKIKKKEDEEYFWTKIKYGNEK